MTPRPGWRCIAPDRSTVARGTIGMCVSKTWTHSSRTIPHLHYRIGNPSSLRRSTCAPIMPPFNDVRVRRAISHAIDRQALIEAVYLRGEPTPAVARGLAEWSLPIEQLGEGAKYYRVRPKEAKRLLAEAGFPRALRHRLIPPLATAADLLDAVQLVQRNLKDVGIETSMKLQEYGAYMATTFAGKFEGMAMGSYRHRLGTGQWLYRPIRARPTAQQRPCQ